VVFSLGGEDLYGSIGINPDRCLEHVGRMRRPFLKGHSQ